MVHLDRLAMASRLAVARASLLDQMSSGTLVISINGQAQDEELHTRMRPFVNRLLNERISEIETDLRKLGVTVP